MVFTLTSGFGGTDPNVSGADDSQLTRWNIRWNIPTLDSFCPLSNLKDEDRSLRSKVMGQNKTWIKIRFFVSKSSPKILWLQLLSDSSRNESPSSSLKMLNSAPVRCSYSILHSGSPTSVFQDGTLETVRGHHAALTLSVSTKWCEESLHFVQPKITLQTESPEKRFCWNDTHTLTHTEELEAKCLVSFYHGTAFQSPFWFYSAVVIKLENVLCVMFNLFWALSD